MKNLVSVLVLTFLSQSLIAQKSIGGIGIAYSRGIPTTDIDQNQIEGNSVSIEIGGFDLERSPIEVSTAVVFGHGEDIAFSWELRTAYVVGISELNFLKFGIGAGEMVSKEFLYEKGGLASYFSDEEEDYIFGRVVLSPYLEWEMDNDEGISFFVRTNWNYFGKAESDFVYSELVNSKEYKGLFYGGFDTSVGLKLGF